MKKNFIDALKYEDNWKLTENEMDALSSTMNDLVDLFSTIGSLRSRDDQEIINKFSKAFYQDRLLALKILFYSRNIRGLGQGERRVFRVIIKWLAQVYPETLYKNISLIPVFGRWDDLYALEGTQLEDSIFKLIEDQLSRDVVNFSMGNPISLLAKWLKSVNTSSKESNRLGKLTAKKLKLTEREYRKYLSLLRDHLNVVETKMSSNNWGEIKFPMVPSKAMSNYRKAFEKRDGDRFSEFLESVNRGEKSINASTLYPYDLVKEILKSNGSTYIADQDKVIEAQWKALPNFIEGNHNILVVADTSGSMTIKYNRNSEVTPIHVSLSLAAYFAERNSGHFKNKFITFSSKPSFVEMKGETLAEKLSGIPRIVDNTDIEAVFDLILKVAIDNNLSSEELPTSIIIISDMEFDQCTAYSDKRWEFYEKMKHKFNELNYKIPNIVFWNVAARNDTFHAFGDKEGVQMASGASPSIFKSIINNVGVTPEELMLKVLSDPIFDEISL